ncbi:ubiquitin-specific protease [Thraustotheca clavata]|uniref:ubiquitinyl hydrolase 1 n=1 Tax=Thraustotheca clavata TaxID=74557 RepID=A0A1W0AB77_9STRA|nr:ubiquitin-specific protease [Thraustotheca clavata]
MPRLDETNTVDVLEPIVFDDETDPSDATLENPSNYCFLNAILHCLFRTRNFRQSLANALQETKRTNDNMKIKCVQMLLDVAMKMKENKGKIVHLDNLGFLTMLDLAQVPWITFPHQDQQDAEECLSFFLNLIHDVVKAPPKTSEPLLSAEQQDIKDILSSCSSLSPEEYSTPLQTLASIVWKSFIAQNPSFIASEFMGQTVQGSMCTECNGLSWHLQESTIISLGLHSLTYPMSLDSCLNHFKQVEDLATSNRVHCDRKCQQKTTHHIQTLFMRLPSVLIFQLNRFTFDNGIMGKNSASVIFPVHRLNMLPYMFNRNANQLNQYHLFAVCAHVGSTLNTGHYLAYTRLTTTSTTSMWLKYNDAQLTILDEKTMLQDTASTAYLLFYERF